LCLHSSQAQARNGQHRCVFEAEWLAGWHG